MSKAARLCFACSQSMHEHKYFESLFIPFQLDDEHSSSVFRHSQSDGK